jgi:serine protease Do
VAGKIKVELHNGGMIEATLLKKTEEKLILDLGFEVLSVPQKEIARVFEAKEKMAPGFTVGDSLFTTSMNRRATPLRDLVDDLGKAVVMIRTPVGLGSGFLIHPDGYVVTNDHVVAGERKISITQFSQSGEELLKKNFDNVRIVATGGNLDLALLKIEGQETTGFPIVPLGQSIELNQGDRVFAIGSPLGLERSVSEGIVSLRNRIISDRIHIQTTAEISPGNSGGPLFNYRGEVVGVNNMKVVSQGAEGLGFAIPVQTLKTFLQNRDAYAFDPRNPNAGFRYLSPPSTQKPTPTK